MLRKATFTDVEVALLYCPYPVAFLRVTSTADGAPEGVVENDTVYVPAAVLLQLKADALPDVDVTLPFEPSIVAITHGR